MSDRPSDCEKCRRRFMTSLTLQAEMRHLAAIYGVATAEAELNERMAEGHSRHERRLP